MSFFSLAVPIIIASETTSRYTDVGIVALSVFPFSIKFLIAPFIDNVSLYCVCAERDKFVNI